MTEFIPYSKQSINKEDIKSVVEVLNSEFLTQGPLVPTFEKSVSDYCSTPYAIAVNSATSALHISCMALGLDKGEILWTSPISFLASANCALYCQAKIDFVDIDIKTFNISIEKLEEKLIKAKRENKLPKILIPVHMCGQSCDMESIYNLSKTYGFRIIEDASHAIGGKYKDKLIGDCSYSDITVFSFHPVKIITSGEGGMALTKDSKLARKLQLLRSHGVTRDKNEMKFTSDGPWYYEQSLLGFNYRMNDIQAALGNNQIKRINEFVLRRNNIATRYDDFLKDLPLEKPSLLKDCYSSFHLYIIRLKIKDLEKNKLKIFVEMRNRNIGVNVHYIPIHIQPFYQKLGFKKGDFGEAESFYRQAISLPIYPDLSEEKQEFVIKTLTQLIGKVS